MVNRWSLYGPCVSTCVSTLGIERRRLTCEFRQHQLLSIDVEQRNVFQKAKPW